MSQCLPGVRLEVPSCHHRDSPAQSAGLTQSTAPQSHAACRSADHLPDAMRPATPDHLPNGDHLTITDCTSRGIHSTASVEFIRYANRIPSFILAYRLPVEVTPGDHIVMTMRHVPFDVGSHVCRPPSHRDHSSSITRLPPPRSRTATPFAWSVRRIVLNE